MQMERAQGTLPSVSEGRRATSPSARHPQPGGRCSSSDGASCIRILTAAAGAPGTSLPAVGSGSNRSPSRRVVQPPSSALASHHAQQQSISGDGDGSFHHAGVATMVSGYTTPTTGDLLACACHENTTIDADLSGATTPSPAPTPPSRAMDVGPTSGPLSDDRPPLPTSAAPPLGAAPPPMVSSGRGRRSLPSMGISIGPTGRPSGARRSLSPTPMEQHVTAAARVTGAAVTCPQTPGTAGTATSYYRTALMEAPGSPGGPMQPRPPLQVPSPSLLDDPSTPSLHSGAVLPSPRVMRLQLLPSPPLHPLGAPIRTPSMSRQVLGVDEFLERSSAPGRIVLDRSTHDSSMIAPSGAAIAAAEAPPCVGGVSGDGDAKQMALLNDLAAAVGELQRRVAEMTPRLPHDATGVSDAGSGYSWCTSTRSSAPGTAVAAGDSGSLGCAFGFGSWAPPPGGAGVSASGAAAAMDERLTLLEAQMKQLASTVFDAASAAAAAPPPPPPPPGVEESVRAATDSCGCSAAAAPNKVPPPVFWSDPGEAVAADRYGSNAAAPKADGLADCSMVMCLALGYAAKSAMQLQAAIGGRGGASASAAAASAAARRKLAPAAGLFALAASNSCAPEATPTAAAAALEHVPSLEQRIESLTGRLSVLEHAAAAAKSDSGAAAAAAAAATAAATAAAAAVTGEEARQQQMHEQHQRELRAAVAEAVASAVQAAAQRQEQLEARVRACEEQAQRQQQMLATGACAVGSYGAVSGKTAAAAATARADEVEVATAAPPPPPRDDEIESLSSRLLKVEGTLAELAEEVRQAGGTAAAAASTLGADAIVLAPPPAADWQRGLAALTRQMQSIVLQVTSARAQSSSVAAEVQVVLEQVRGAQATAAAAAASARQASAAAAAAERSAAAALDVVDAAATAATATDGGRARRCRSSSGGVVAAGCGTAAARPSAAGGLRSPRRSEVWLAGPQAAVPCTAPFAVAAPPLVAAFAAYGRQQQQQQQQNEEESGDDDDYRDEAEPMSKPTDAPPPPPPPAALPGRRLAARDVGFRILPDGADVAIGGGGATLYGVSASRASVLDSALTRLAEVEANLQDLQSKLGRGLALRVTHDELRESVAQMDLKLRATLAGIGGGAAGAGLYSRSASLAASIGFRGFSAAARLGGGGDGGGSGGDANAAAAAAGGGGDCGDDAAAVDGAAARGGGRTAAAGRQPGAGTWAQGRYTAGGGGGDPSDSVSSRGEGLAGQGNTNAVLAHLQRSVGILEQRLEAVETGVAQHSTLAERVAETAEQQQLPPLPPLQQQQQQQTPADRPALPVHGRSGSVARRSSDAGRGSGGGGGSAVLLGLDEQLVQMAHRMEAGEGAQGVTGREVRGIAEPLQAAALVGAPLARGGRELARSGRRGGPARGG